MSKTPWIRFFPSDWLAGSRGMTAVQSGVYITLVMMMYERAEPIFEDKKWLANLCGCGVKALTNALNFLIEHKKIIRTEKGLWNLRVEEEIGVARDKSEAISKARSKAANARWSKKDDAKNMQENQSIDTVAMQMQCKNNANAMQMECYPEPEPETNNSLHSLLVCSSKKSKKSKKVYRKKTKDPAVQAEELSQIEADFHEFWREYPNKVGRIKARKAFSKEIKKTPLLEILQGLRRYKDEKPEWKEWMHPSTFLNQQRWLDDYAQSPPQRNVTPVRTSPRQVRISPADAAKELLEEMRRFENEQNHTIDITAQIVN